MQREAVVSMIHLNKPKEERSAASSSWRVLVLDRGTRDIVGPLLSVSDLRKEGITLHLMLHSERQPIPDVDAVYFVAGSMDNINRIVQDARDSLYGRMFLNFAGGISRSLLEKLAQAVAKDGTYGRIASVDDQFTNFVCAYPGVFSQQWPGSFRDLYSNDVTDADMQSMVKSVASCLLAVAATRQTVPVICAQRGGAAEMVGQQLSELIRSSPLFSRAKASFLAEKRAGFLIVDRSLDVGTPLAHPFSYGAMLHDDLGLRSGQVTVPTFDAQGRPAAGQKRSFQLADSFWLKHYTSSFPVVADSVEAELKQYNADIADVQRRTGMSIEQAESSTGASVLTDLPSQTSELASTLTLLPVLQQKKRSIDCHTALAYALLSEIKARELDVYAALEESLLASFPVDEDRMLQLIRADKDTETDKLRLFLICFLSTESAASRTVLLEMENKLRTDGVNLSSFDFVKSFKTFLSGSSGVQRASQESNSLLGGLASKAKVLGEQLKVLASGGQRGQANALPLARMVRELVQRSSVPSTEEMRGSSKASTAYLSSLSMIDPRLPSGASSVSLQVVDEWIVFVVGGGSLLEYTNILLNCPAGARVSYGSTEIVTGREFLDQLALLAQPSKSGAAGGDGLVKL